MMITYWIPLRIKNVSDKFVGKIKTYIFSSTIFFKSCRLWNNVENFGRARAEPDGTRAETRFRLSPKRTSPFESAGESVQSIAGSRGERISFSNAGYTTSRGRVRLLATHSIRQFILHFPSRASPCATRFRRNSNTQQAVPIELMKPLFLLQIACL